MVERQKSRSLSDRGSTWFLGGAAVTALAAAAWIFTDPTLTVLADTPLARPASTLSPASPPASPPTETGIKAKPKVELSGLRGLATYYGAVLDGHRTASGERFDMFAMTAAHKTLPFGTLVRVVNIKTGRSVDVKINDRGVLPGDHVIDLSYGAAKRLNILRTGAVNVELEILALGPTPHSLQ